MCVVIVERSKNTARRVHVVYAQRLGQVALCQHTQRTDSILTITTIIIVILENVGYETPGYEKKVRNVWHPANWAITVSPPVGYYRLHL